MTIIERLRQNKDSIIADYLAGANTAELGLKHDCSNAYIWRFLKQNGVELRQFAVSARDELVAYLDWLYKDAAIYLPRKRDKYLECVADVRSQLRAA